LRQHGHPPAIVLTDNVRGYKNFLTQVFPHLTTIAPPSAESTRINVAQPPDDLVPKVLSAAEECDDIVAGVMHMYLSVSREENHDYIVGLNAEWNKGN
ncbi:uncharacterized protein V1513DRAFT_375256, partial [Lipomyces chichibuensis]|uniref:uncharacterized protein n=1 Tax=Lipomyces chichibuensis TaxID=1546026 RepID=UPI003343AE44